LVLSNPEWVTPLGENTKDNHIPFIHNQTLLHL
jgi:hypothetical protein